MPPLILTRFFANKKRSLKKSLVGIAVEILVVDLAVGQVAEDQVEQDQEVDQAASIWRGFYPYWEWRL